jgi:predicted DsbA family dithiol-disulfide isomerase/uncharacterized membrane protein
MELLAKTGMRKNIWFWLTLLLVGAALVASAMLLVDYVRPSPVFCAAEGGCGRVRMTVFARPLGIPLPAIGLAGMLALGLSALTPGKYARIVQLSLAGIAALAALGLLGVQWMIGTLCPYCAVVDGSAIGLGILSTMRWRHVWDPPGGRVPIALSVAGLLVAIGIPLGVGFGQKIIPEGIPAPIAAEIKRTGRGKVTVVDFVDFECPFCRMTHHEVKPLFEERKDKLRVARKQVPLRMHPHALDAAKAACCGEALGKGDEIADALFEAPPEELTREGCEKLAQTHGLDPAKFRACVDDPATKARIEKDVEAFHTAKGHGLPTIWVDGTKLEGAQDRETLASTLDSAIHAL